MAATGKSTSPTNVNHSRFGVGGVPGSGAVSVGASWCCTPSEVSGTAQPGTA